MRFVVIDLPQANSISIRYWLKRNGQEVVFYSDFLRLESDFYDAVLIPGVGAFDYASDFLVKNHIDKFIAKSIESGKLVIGICLGMQLMFNCSEEGAMPGLSLFDASVHKLQAGEAKIPNIGWRSVLAACNTVGPLGGGDKSNYYFMHGYAVSLQDAKNALKDAEILFSNCNGQFLAAFRKNNLVGIQFHPEKSYGSGDDLLIRIVKAHASI